jgi:hypothetical protein
VVRAFDRRTGIREGDPTSGSKLSSQKHLRDLVAREHFDVIADLVHRPQSGGRRSAPFSAVI